MELAELHLKDMHIEGEVGMNSIQHPGVSEGCELFFIALGRLAGLGGRVARIAAADVDVRPGEPALDEASGIRFGGLVGVGRIGASGFQLE